MDVSPYVSLKYVEEYLENEIKEISQRWAGFMINKIALERVLREGKISEEEQRDYDFVFGRIGNRTGKELQRVIERMPKEQRDNYTKVSMKKQQERDLEEAKKGLKEFVEFLEVATNLKGDVEKERNTSKTANIDITYENQ